MAPQRIAQSCAELRQNCARGVRERRRVLRPRADLAHAFPHHPPHELRRRERLAAAEAELPRAAAAPRVHVAGVRQGEDVVQSARDLAHALRGDLGELRRHRDEGHELVVEVVLLRRHDRELVVEVLHLHVQLDALLEQRLVLPLQAVDVLLRLDQLRPTRVARLLGVVRGHLLLLELHLRGAWRGGRQRIAPNCAAELRGRIARPKCAPRAL